MHGNINLRINGEPAQIESGTTARGLIVARTRNGGDDGIAMACNGEVVPRTQWDEIYLSEGDDVEILEATCGG